MKRFVLCLAIIAALLSLNVSAESYKNHMKILAVSDKVNGFGGITADLYLEVQPGEGKVFIESFPLSKIDTQVSTRFAKEIVCNDFEIDCDKHNFFYTIRADTSLVEGPSAGAASAVLTAAALQGLDVKNDVSISGTINSGGLIGPVGGLKEKIYAASRAGIKKVLIPKGERFVTNKTSNSSIDLVEFGKSSGVEVVEVSDVREALFHFTGERFDSPETEVVIDSSYSDTMAFLAEALCNKSNSLVKHNFNTTKELQEVFDSARNLTEKGNEAFNMKEFYSAASYCFGSNVKYKYLYLESRSYSAEELISYGNSIIRDARNLEDSRPKIETITDLQSYTSMEERILEAYDNINSSIEHLSENRTNDAIFELAYAEERVFSARAWSMFFGKGGKKFVFDDASLESSCRKKISEAEERFEYAKLFFEISLSGIRKDIDRAYDDLSGSHYELCLSKAAKAKAESDVLISSINIDKMGIEYMIDKKLEVARRTIAGSIKKGIFPIVGYSYYEYANSLKGSDPYSALLYAEYALEMSNMDLYFSRIEGNGAKSVKSQITGAVLAPFAVGLIIGSISVIVLLSVKSRKRVNKKVFRKAIIIKRRSA